MPPGLHDPRAGVRRTEAVPAPSAAGGGTRPPDSGTRSAADRGVYPLGMKVSGVALAAVPPTQHDWHGSGTRLATASQAGRRLRCRWPADPGSGSGVVALLG